MRISRRPGVFSGGVAPTESAKVRLQADLGGGQELHHLSYHGVQAGEDDLQGAENPKTLGDFPLVLLANNYG